MIDIFSKSNRFSAFQQDNSTHKLYDFPLRYIENTSGMTTFRPAKVPPPRYQPFVQVPPLQQNHQIKMLENNYRIIDLQALTGLLQSIQDASLHKKCLKYFKQLYGISFENISTSQLLERAGKLEQRAGSFLEQGLESCWAFGEQKIFYSVLPYLIYLHNIQIKELDQQSFPHFKRIFVTKTFPFISFELRHILSSTFRFRAKWSQEEEGHLKEIMGHMEKDLQSTMKWKKVAFQIYLRSGFFRAPRDCRQRWINHINPEVLKKNWHPSQDLKLLLLMRKHGRKWALISKAMGGIRTEHMIKNRVNSLIKKWIPGKVKNMSEKYIRMIIDCLEKNDQGLQMKEKIDSEEEESPKETIESQGQDNQQELVNTYDMLSLDNQFMVIRQGEFEQNWQYEQSYTYINHKYYHIPLF